MLALSYTLYCPGASRTEGYFPVGGEWWFAYGTTCKSRELKPWNQPSINGRWELGDKYLIFLVWVVHIWGVYIQVPEGPGPTSQIPVIASSGFSLPVSFSTPLPKLVSPSPQILSRASASKRNQPKTGSQHNLSTFCMTEDRAHKLLPQSISQACEPQEWNLK